MSDHIPEHLGNLINKHFPKGECKERGAAMVMLAEFLMWHQGQTSAKTHIKRFDISTFCGKWNDRVKVVELPEEATCKACRKFYFVELNPQEFE